MMTPYALAIMLAGTIGKSGPTFEYPYLPSGQWFSILLHSQIDKGLENISCIEEAKTENWPQ